MLSKDVVHYHITSIPVACDQVRFKAETSDGGFLEGCIFHEPGDDKGEVVICGELHTKCVVHKMLDHLDDLIMQTQYPAKVSGHIQRGGS